MLAPSTRAGDLLAGRRVVHGHAPPRDVVAVGPAVPVSRRSQMGVPVGVRANLRLALARGQFDLVHGFEPGLPSLSYLALRETDALTVATFCSTDRLGYPPARSQREKLLARIDALLALSEPIREAAAERFPGDYELVSPGVSLELFEPGPKRNRITVELRPNERPGVRGCSTRSASCPTGRRCSCGRPRSSRGPRSRATSPAASRSRTARDGAAARRSSTETAIFVPGIDGAPRAAARGAGRRLRDRRARRRRRAARARRGRRGAPRRGRRTCARESRRPPRAAAASGSPSRHVAAQLDELYRRLTRRRRTTARRAAGDPLADRPWIVADLHMHTSWSFDCAVDPAELVDHAEAEGLGAIAVTDHNVFGGALETLDEARERDLIVIPGEEIKTDEQGEVIGLFLEREIPRGLPFADTIAAIREQNGLVYLPHPFDRMHTIPDPATLHRHLADIDVLEVYNARLLFEAQNDEALRFARKYDLTMGAGSDAHVLQGVGTGALRMRSFRDPEEFMISLRSAEILRRPKSLAYLQSLKWMAQVKEKVR